MIIRFGNEAAKHKPDQDGPHVPLPGRRITTLQVPPDIPLAEAFTAITAAGRGTWDNQSDAPPAWVESDNESIATLLADHFQCVIGQPDGWEEEVD